MIRKEIDTTREFCLNALARSEFDVVRDRLKQNNMADPCAAVQTIAEGGAIAVISDIVRQVSSTGLPSRYAAERFFLLHALLQNIGRIKDLDIAPSVKKLLCDEFVFYAEPENHWVHLFKHDTSSYASMCKVACFRRFPAGQVHWEMSGLPRSWLLKVPSRCLGPLSYFIVKRLKGFGPLFESHLFPRRKNPLMLIESESNRSYYRMAKSMELQPSVKGIIAISWLHSEPTLRASPHLSWVNRIFIENGAFITHIGPARVNDGFLTGSKERQKLYEAGEYKPLTGLVLWPRANILTWADSHPELADHA